jgi:single-strand DNA-binding protein
MASLNKVLLMGNITRDPELRYIPSGSAVTTFTLAMNRVYKLQNGEKKEEVTFVRVVVWGKQAENCKEYLSKGSPVFVEGRIQSRTWDGPDGQKRNATEVIASNIQFLRGAGGAGAGQGGGRGRDISQDAPKDEMPDIQLDDIAMEEGKNTEEVPF